MNQLIAVNTSAVGNDAVQTVNARDLHTFLEVGKDFSNWIKGRIAQYGFVEGVDYVCSPDRASEGRGGSNKKEYHLTLDMAKELSMVERNPKGKQARRYFIECERRASDPEALAKAYIAKLHEQKRIGEAAAKKLVELEAPVAKQTTPAELEKYVAEKLRELAPKGYSEIRIDVPSGHRSSEIVRIAGRLMTDVGRHPRFTPYGDNYLIVESLV